MIQLLLIFSDWSFLFIRLVLGLILVVHGWPKIKNLKQNAENFSALSFKPAFFWGLAAGLVEFIGGLMIILGFFTQIICVLVVILFLVAILKVKKSAGFENGYEFDLLLLASAVLLALNGPGALSLDEFFGILLY